MWIRWDDSPDDVVAEQAEWVLKVNKKGSAVNLISGTRKEALIKLMR